MIVSLRGRFCAHGIEGSDHCPDCHAEATTPAPCKCMRNWAYIAPTHDGHCCFRSPTATCHEAEFEEWKAKDWLRRT